MDDEKIYYIVKYAKNLTHNKNFDDNFILEYRKYNNEIIDDSWQIVEKDILFLQLETNFELHKAFTKANPKNRAESRKSRGVTRELMDRIKELEDIVRGKPNA